MTSVSISTVMKKAISTSLLTKGVGAVYQVVSLPLIIGLLTEEEFGYFSILTALIGWVTILQGGIGPSITRLYARNSRVSIKSRIEAVTLGIVFVYGAILLVALMVLSYAEIIIPKYRFEAFLLSILVFLTLVFSLADSVRLGLHQQHISNIYMAVSNILVVASLYLVSKQLFLDKYDFLLIIMAIYLPPVIVKIINSIEVYGGLSNLPKMISYNRNKRLYKIVGLLITSVIFVQISGMLIKSISAMYWGVYDIKEAGRLEVIFRTLTILGTFYPMIQIPLWPLLIRARREGERVILRNISMYLVLGFFSFSILILFVLGFGGESLFSIWLGKMNYFSVTEIYAVGFYFIAISISQALIVIYMGYEKFSVLSKVLFSEALLYALVIAAAHYMSYSIDLSDMLYVLCFLRVLVGIYLAARFYRYELCQN
jgi:O-antigen/teichoic acid export membrane protein